MNALIAHSPAKECGKRIATSSGKTYYEFREGNSGNTIVFIHGYAIPSGVWEKNFYTLAEHGHSVLRFDRCGVGRSAPPPGEHSMPVFVNQLKELVDVLQPPLPLTLVGLSMGAAVAAGFSAAYPALVRKLCLIAPAVPEALPGLSRLMLVPGLAQFLMSLLAKSVLKRNLKKILPTHPGESSFLRECLEQGNSKSYITSLLHTFRHTLSRNTSFSYASLPPSLPPVCLIWGTADTVVPFTNAVSVRRDLGKCDFHPLDGAGHCPVWERADEVNDILSRFVQKSD